MSIQYENTWFMIEKQGKYHFMVEKAPGGVVIVAESNEGILFVEVERQTKQQLLIELPRGSSDDGETAIDAAKRELLEETGFTPISKPKVIGTIMPNSSVMKTEIDVVSMSTATIQTVMRTDNEVRKHVWLSYKDIEHAIVSNMIICGITKSALLMHYADTSKLMSGVVCHEL
ncbi:NUDIX hydrolase [Vibrio splendidus]|nr:NUDIX hydrolase [Vibrio splendidus]MCC4880469.1 NUDIX hydrolase [Vibrio splendidus]